MTEIRPYRNTLSNAAALAFGAAGEAVLQFAFLLIASRVLGPEEFGFFGYLNTLVGLTLVFTSTGLAAVAVREMSAQAASPSARDRAHTVKSVFAALFRLRLVLSLTAFLIAVGLSLVSPLAPLYRRALWISFAYVLIVPFDLAPLLDAHKLSRWDVPGRIAGRAAALAVLFAIWKSQGTLTVADAAAATLLVIAVGVFFCWPIAFRLKLNPALLAPTREVPRLLRLSFPITWATFTAAITQYGQTVFVQWLSTPLETGWFALASRLILPVLIAKGICARLQLPLLAEVVADRQAFTSRVERFAVVMALLFMPVAALGIPACEVLLIPLFGHEYAGAVLPLQISLSHLLFSGVGSLLTTALFALGKQRAYTWILTIGFAAALAGGRLLIPSLGALGAAYAGWIAEILITVLALTALLPHVKLRVFGKLLRIACSSLLTIGLYFALDRWVGLSGGIALAAAACVLPLALWRTRSIPAEEVHKLVAEVHLESPKRESTP